MTSSPLTKNFQPHDFLAAEEKFSRRMTSSPLTKNFQPHDVLAADEKFSAA
ncbi:MAG: hypothetical protein IJG80_08610 [Selenomonadaceae bacterium]|nr:hypothetical protein [Selenomonadaceae bacterium]MBQ3726739.1 hypothetical protein [Selenomonadaceae bacterium]MBQ9498121.1 hypothetical protein [Selenomonadaceae bacterium]